MANEQNLIPIQEVNSRRSREEHKKDSAKGGKKSGEVRRKRKAMKEQMEMLLSLPCNIQDKYGNNMAEVVSTLFGINKDEVDNQMLMITSLWKTAINSNSSQQIQAVREIRDLVKDGQNIKVEEKEIQYVKDGQNINEDNRVQIINDLPRDDEDG